MTISEFARKRGSKDKQKRKGKERGVVGSVGNYSVINRKEYKKGKRNELIKKAAIGAGALGAAGAGIYALKNRVPVVDGILEYPTSAGLKTVGKQVRKSLAAGQNNVKGLLKGSKK